MQSVTLKRRIKAGGNSQYHTNSTINNDISKIHIQENPPHAYLDIKTYRTRNIKCICIYISAPPNGDF